MKYPIGIQTFEDIRRDGYVYVDKTACQPFKNTLITPPPGRRYCKVNTGRMGVPLPTYME